MQAVNESGRSNNHIDVERGSFSAIEAVQLDLNEASGFLGNPLEQHGSEQFERGVLELDPSSQTGSLSLSPHTFDPMIDCSTVNPASIDCKGAAEEGSEGDTPQVEGVAGSRCKNGGGQCSGRRTVPGDSDSKKSAMTEIEVGGTVVEGKALWEVGKWMFGTSVVLGLVFGLFSDREQSPVQVSLVCGIQVCTSFFFYVPVPTFIPHLDSQTRE